MGADLYLVSLHEPAHEKWEPRFVAAVAKRDCHEPGTREHERWHQRVLKYYDKMYGPGYFRDPYNDWDVLWKFGMSWWGDVIPMLDTEGFLPVAETKRLLQILAECEETFRQNLAELPEREARYFQCQADKLRAFLKTAILRAEPVRCSL